MKNRIYLLFLFVLVISGLFYMFGNKADVELEETKNAIMSVFDVEKDLEKNSFNKSVLGKSYLFNGVVTDVEGSSITVDSVLVVYLTNYSKQMKKGDLVKVRSQFTGYDELLELIKMNKGIILN
ncbi:hypothetical protein N9901_01415 [Flavobacteriaceae bacterium]|nr:hypothetical protein [Flavobacteriaceae bacterium]